MRKDGKGKSNENFEWKEDVNNENNVVWSNESKIANVKIVAERIPFTIQWKMWPEINNRKGDTVSIDVPNKRCLESMITSMKGIIDNHLTEASKSGKTIEEVIKNAKLW